MEVGGEGSKWERWASWVSEGGQSDLIRNEAVKRAAVCEEVGGISMKE